MRDSGATSDLSWAVSGTYFEACNCDAVSERGRPSSYETCDFAVSWRITEGRISTLDLSGLSVMMAGTYSNHVTPGHESMQAGGYVFARTQRPAAGAAVVWSGTAGHDRPGHALVMDVFRVADAPLRWEVQERCGFVSDFAYNSDS